MRLAPGCEFPFSYRPPVKESNLELRSSRSRIPEYEDNNLVSSHVEGRALDRGCED